MDTQNPAHHIGSLNEGPLHASLKEWYARSGDRTEAPVDGYVIDIVRGDLLIEIQTGHFAGIKRKMVSLCSSHPVRLVCPVAQEKWLVKLPMDSHGKPARRKSPGRGVVEHVFERLVSFPRLLLEPNFSLEVVLYHEEEVRCYDPKRAWRRRRGWVTHERRLLKVVGQRLFETPADMAQLLPPGLEEPFTTGELAHAMCMTRKPAQAMAYCLREMGVIMPVGKRGREVEYEIRY